MLKPQIDVRILPFRGEYYDLKPEAEHLVKNLIYPVPDSRFPFLGVHLTRMIGGGIEAGPNAVLALAKEGYSWGDININELMQTLGWPGFYKVAAKYWSVGVSEVYRSLSKAQFTRSLQQLVPEIQQTDLVRSGAGVRAQACSLDGQLLDDFHILQGANSIHVLNAPSPAATSCLAIGESLAEIYFHKENR
jgi:L-2-hydroxyglutarate oxidase